MRTPARATLGRRYAGQAIGYSVMALDGTPHAPFTREGVREVQPGHYVAAVDAPPAGGWIAWGSAGNPNIAEAELPPTPDLSPIREALADLESQITEAVRTLPALAVTVDTSAFDGAVTGLRADLRTLTEAEQQQRAAALAAMGAVVDDLRGRVPSLDMLDQAIGEVQHLHEAAGRFAELTDAAVKLIAANTGKLIAANTGVADLGVMLERLDHLRAEMARLHEDTLTERHASRQAEAGQRRAIAIFDDLLAQLELA